MRPHTRCDRNNGPRLRNGIYRVWYKGSAQGAAASLLVDGQFIACNGSHKLLGRYQDNNGRFTAALEAWRHTPGAPSPNRVELDHYHMILEGLSTGEVIAACAHVPELPGFALNIEYVWIGEV